MTGASRTAAAPGPTADRSDTPSRHGPIAQVLIALSPLGLIPLTYLLGGWIAATIDIERPESTVNRLGFGLHQTAAATADRHVFGVVPSVWLQEHLVDGTSHWYDAVSSLVYASHFVMLPVVTALVWFRHRERYRAWVASVLTFTAVGVAGYVVFPASPPWLASGRGLIGPVARTSDVGWDHLHLGFVSTLFGSGQAQSNPIAAMPSLHAGSAMLIALFLWSVAGSRWRTVLAAYPLVMGLALVYTGEHYLVDVVAGWLTAAVAVTVGLAVLRRDRPRGGREATRPT